MALGWVQPLLRSALFPRSGRQSITSPPMSEHMPTATRPGGYVPRCSFTYPISDGDADPARFPIDTIIAMPTAAVSFEKLSLIAERNGPFKPNTPSADTESAIIVISGEVTKKHAIMPPAATNAAIAVCHLRS